MEQQLPLEKELRDLFAKFPAFPESLIDILVTLAPWLCLLGGILGLLGLLSLVGVSGAWAIGLGAYGSTWAYYASVIGGAVVAVLYILAFTPLRTQKKRGWNLLYYAFLLNLLIQLVTFHIFALILGFLIGGWILFQIRPKYVLI